MKQLLFTIIMFIGLGLSGLSGRVQKREVTFTSNFPFEDTTICIYRLDTMQAAGRNLRNMLNGFAGMSSEYDFELTRLDYNNGVFWANQLGLTSTTTGINLGRRFLSGLVLTDDSIRGTLLYIHGDSAGKFSRLLVPSGDSLMFCGKNITGSTDVKYMRYRESTIRGYMDWEYGWIIPGTVILEHRTITDRNDSTVFKETPWKVVWRAWNMDYYDAAVKRYEQVVKDSLKEWDFKFNN